MRIALPELAIAACFSACSVCGGQNPANLTQASGANPSAPSAPASAAAAPAPSVSQILQPALDQVQGTLNGIRVDKWKRGGIRDEASQNVSQIIRDLQGNLPPLVHDAESAPGSVSKMLPVARNVAALYDVLLRVVEASRVVAPDDQVKQLQQALITLGNARLALGDRMQSSAETMEKQVVDLRTTVQRQQAFRAVIQVPVVLPCAPSTTHRATRRSTKPRPQTKPAGSNGSSSSSPNGPQQNTNNPKQQPSSH